MAVANDADAEALVRNLLASGYRVVASLEQEAVGRLATVRLQPPSEGPEGVVVDMLFASSGVEPEIVRASEVLEALPGLPVPVARAGDLLALKVLSNGPERPQIRSTSSRSCVWLTKRRWGGRVKPPPSS